MDLSKVSRFRGPLSDAGKKHRCENNLCVYCGEAGHFASSCRNRRPKPAVLSMASVPGEETTEASPARILYETKN